MQAGRTSLKHVMVMIMWEISIKEHIKGAVISVISIFKGIMKKRGNWLHKNKTVSH